jgi:sensor histidine kinase YesM
MHITRKLLLTELRDIALLILLGILMTASGLTCRDCIDNPRVFWIIASFTSLIWVFLWKGNHYLGCYVDTKISWIETPVKRLTVGIITTMAYTFLAIYTLGFLYEVLFDIQLMFGAIFSVIITIIISLFMHGRGFLLNWKKSVVMAEQLKRENMAAQYESLKSQVNPHFLFNSFNTLSNLVYEDQDKAVKFIKQLSEVYRYVLDTRNKEVVPLSEELKFINSYIYLQQIRFGDKLHFRVNITSRDAMVAPLALQMLIENAIKHNIVSEDDPLKINIEEEGEYLVVENNLQRKSSIGDSSTGVGLENIAKRYEFLSNKKVQVEEAKSKFTVRLPLIFPKS